MFIFNDHILGIKKNCCDDELESHTDMQTEIDI